MTAARPTLLARALLALVRAYQIGLSPWLGGQCRFEPSCSRYAANAIRIHGGLLGALLSAVRLCKCHPLHPGGYDPPPPTFRLQWRNYAPTPEDATEPLLSSHRPHSPSQPHE